MNKYGINGHNHPTLAPKNKLGNKVTRGLIPPQATYTKTLQHDLAKLARQNQSTQHIHHGKESGKKKKSLDMGYNIEYNFIYTFWKMYCYSFWFSHGTLYSLFFFC